MYNTFKGKRVLITGGTGSFGSSFAKFLLKNTELSKLIIFSRDEFKQHYLAKELNDDRVSFFLGDVRDLHRLQRAFYNTDIVVHAAALKQVPALEYNPFEAIKTNVLGTQNTIDAAIDQEVPKVLLISTDKAVQPINLYGASKLCAEKLCIAGNSYVRAPRKTRFSVVRYGNVVGSRGSLIEMLRDKPKTVKITDPEMTRFWITLEQSFELVLTALDQMEGGEIFVPKIPSMKIIDLFDAIAPNAKKEIIGIRPGEKIHEVLLTEHETKRALEFTKHFVILPESHQWTTKNPYAKYRKNGKKLPPDFIFASDTNDKWLTQEQLRKIVGI